jgi:sphingosine kinase
LKLLKKKLLDLIYKDSAPAEFDCEKEMNMYLSEKEKADFDKKKDKYVQFDCKNILKDPKSFALKKNEKTNINYYKNILVIINPNSGTKKAKQMFEKVEKVFKANGMLFEVYETKFRGDCISYLAEMKLEKLKSFDGIFCFSGDGLVHEVLNGFASRRDWDMKENPITLAHFPSGSGCALSENIARFSNTESNLESVVYAACHWRTTSLPIYKYKITTHDGTEKIIYGFLSLSLGFFADVDIGSEIMRFLGSARFDIYGAFKLMGMGTLPLRVKWTQIQDKPLDNSNLVESRIVEQNENLDIIKEESEVEEEKKEKEVIESQIVEEDEKFDLNLSSKISIEFPSKWNEPEFRGKVFSLLAFTMPFFSRNYLASPILLNNLNSINLQIGTSKMGRFGYSKYVLGHEDHKKEKHPLLIDVLARQLEVELLEDVIKREKGEETTGHKKSKIELVIDGETYKDLGFRKIQMIPTDKFFNVII